MNYCFSGGAEGADKLWGELAKSHGHEVLHYTFKEHPFKEGIVLIQEELNIADPFLKRANKKLGRKFPSKNNFVNNLLRRNFYQVRETERVYAVASFLGDLVLGGTAWAVQMYIDLCHDKDIDPECYVFDQMTTKPGWVFWNRDKLIWESIDKVPTPSGRWTGIGSRELRPEGKNAIESVW